MAQNSFGIQMLGTHRQRQRGRSVMVRKQRGGGGGNGTQDSDCLLFINVFLVDWLPRPLGKLQSFPFSSFGFAFHFSLFLTNWSPCGSRKGEGGRSQQNILYACMQMSSISGRFRRHYRGPCAQKKARGDRQKNCQLSKLYKMNVTKIENLCAATGRDRRGQEGAGWDRT